VPEILRNVADFFFKVSTLQILFKNYFEKEKNTNILLSVADPEPGSSASLTPGFWILDGK
jgi:hypothetical protein